MERITTSSELVTAKAHFDNGYRIWDGLECPFCGEVYDPDSVKDEEYYPDGINGEKVDIIEWVCQSCKNGWANC